MDAWIDRRGPDPNTNSWMPGGSMEGGASLIEDDDQQRQERGCERERRRRGHLEDRTGTETSRPRGQVGLKRRSEQ